MAQHLVVALKALLPLYLLIAVGMLIRWKKMLTDTELKHVNAMVFKVFFFCMMFYNLYTTSLKSAVRPALITFCITVLCLIVVIFGFLICTIEKDNKSRGAMLQGVFRSNFVLLGLPMVENIFGSEALAVPTMMIAVVVPIYNIVSVLILESFRGEGKFSLFSTIIKVFQNPMIVGALLGAFFLVTDIFVPEPVLKPIGQIAHSTSPVALIILGASFRIGTISEEKRELLFVVVSRLLVIPALVLGSGYYLGFRGVDFVTLICIFATPCAVASFAMAQQLGSNAELAGASVVLSSAFSSITLFCWIVLFQVLGVF